MATMDPTTINIATTAPTSIIYPLKTAWTLWAHFSDDKDWSESSYHELYTFNDVRTAVALTRCLPEHVIRGSMLFIMRKGIKPTWEDPQNRDGGAFSYKIPVDSVQDAWRMMTYGLIGEVLVPTAVPNGITISPKRGFCVVKIWMSTCEQQDPNSISVVHPSMRASDCMFKPHKPEY